MHTALLPVTGNLKASIPENSPRVPAVDLVRGSLVLLTTAAMLLVPAVREWPDNPICELVVHQFTPSVWGGLTACDLIMPGFLFVTGASAFLSVDRQRQAGNTPGQILIHLFRRSAVLFLIGLLLENALTGTWREVRWVGPFQRVVLCHFSVAVLCLIASGRTLAMAAAALLGNYAVAFEMYPGPAPISPAAIPESAVTIQETESDAYSPEANMAAQFDRAFLPGLKYFGNWDPDGLLTTIPALVLAMSGAIAVRWLLQPSRSAHSLPGWGVFVVAAGLINAGILLDSWQPINAWLLTLPFAVIAAGVALVGLAGAFYVERSSALSGWLGFVRRCGRHSLLIMVSLRLIHRYAPSLASSVMSISEGAPIFSQSLTAGFGVVAVCWLVSFLSRKEVPIQQ